MTTRREVTQAVKAGLKEAGIIANVKHGHGTASSWLHIHVYKDAGFIQGGENFSRIVRLAAKLAGRESWTNDCINAYFHLNETDEKTSIGFAGCAPQFQADIRRIAMVAGKTAEEVYALWRDYQKTCEAYDQSCLGGEFVEWYKEQLGGNIEALRKAAGY